MIYYNFEARYLQYGQQIEKLASWEAKTGVFFFCRKKTEIEESSSSTKRQQNIKDVGKKDSRINH
jgi:hypothetical protein